MSESDGVADSTDWLSTSLSSFAAVEAALRCRVCKDFYKTPMITSCSHTFCSLCIRRALSSDGKCPLCRVTEQELKLRSNWSMEEAVEAFTKARDAALCLARNQWLSCLSPKRKLEDDEPVEGHAAPETKRLRSSARLNKSCGEKMPSATNQHEEDILQDSDDDYIPDPNAGLVACPSCQRKMKAWQVFGHLETCPGPISKEQPSEELNRPTGLDQLQRRREKALERLPPLHYPMLKEQALRKKLLELGISNQGPRVLLEKRHKEWLTLWNANCDAAVPKKRSELLFDLDVWERTQGGRAPTFGKAVQNAEIIKDKDFDGIAWSTKHDASFKDLIASARKSREVAKHDLNIDGSTALFLQEQEPAVANSISAQGFQEPSNAGMLSSVGLRNEESIAIDGTVTGLSNPRESMEPFSVDTPASQAYAAKSQYVRVYSEAIPGRIDERQT